MHSESGSQRAREMAGMKPINVKVLMGHSTGILTYYRATENGLLED